jgi:hypothetical protein
MVGQENLENHDETRTIVLLMKKKKKKMGWMKEGVFPVH